MSDLPSSLAAAVSVFASTNVDDLVLLTAFFADPSLSRGGIVSGQFLGIGALVALSAAAGLGALAIPASYVALLGIAPLALGIRAWRQRHADPEPDELPEPAPASAGSAVGLLAAVAAVTIANGGDNLGVYVPLFAREPGAIPLYVAVFAAMTGLWLLASFALVRHPATGRQIRNLGQRALPLVLVAIGLWILSGARALLG